MTSPRPPAGMGAALALMAFVLLWSAVLAAGFAYAAIAGSDDLSTTRTVTYALLSGFTGLLALRTGYEMFRKIRLRFHELRKGVERRNQER